MSKNIINFLIIVAAIILIILVWGYFPLICKNWIPYLKSEETTTQYDAFNALFSALAFTAVIVTLVLQSRELELQRKELVNSVNAQRDSAAALQDQARKNLLAIQADAYFKVIEALQSDQVIKAREEVFKLQTGDSVKKYSDWTDNDKKNAEELIRRYDSIGIMAFNEMLPYELIVDSWGSSLKRSWIIVKEHLNHLRNTRNAPELWDDYEWLVKKAYEYEDQYINKDLTYQSGRKESRSVKIIADQKNEADT